METEAVGALLILFCKLRMEQFYSTEMGPCRQKKKKHIKLSRASQDTREDERRWCSHPDIHSSKSELRLRLRPKLEVWV